ncbi:4-alpha-glucanotransferase [Sulfurivermis fontis]|uniref:4-alpha-glucanotransferase n=1 Tax=Sulfurivermis fontis TaxID=1972068 RepID=UPI000FD919E6|nr:4-alpha-glucanotransferase [Sulfurivermis fontis]
MTQHIAHTPLQRRQAGVLLHPTSLPGPWYCGDLGAEAWHFVDFLAAAGQQVWQILPLGPTHEDLSPYQSLSAHAGNPQLISIEALQAQGWLEAVIPDPRREAKAPLVAHAWQGFQARADATARTDLQQFIDNTHWLDDYILFSLIKRLENGRGWTEWPAPLRDRDPAALAALRQQYADELAVLQFEQFVFDQQWQALKRHANGKGIAIFGDMPIFVAHDSADVWAQRECFDLDESGRPTVVAGVPPDYFSATGQRWGNPHYDWEWMESDGFGWWRQRLEGQLRLFDLVRIDHFRGFEAYWEIPAHEETAINGRWMKAPGDALFAALAERFDPLPVVAEDLGTITAEVTALRDKYALPGMRILHFAFEGGPDNPYLPHNHTENSVVYTGTHDNDTTLGWWNSGSESLRHSVLEYLGQPSEAMPWPLIRAAYASVARLAIVPLQDVLELGGEHRMNTPGTTVGNWRWRFRWDQVAADRAPRLRRLAELYRRL